MEFHHSVYLVELKDYLDVCLTSSRLQSGVSVQMQWEFQNLKWKFLRIPLYIFSGQETTSQFTCSSVVIR